MDRFGAILKPSNPMISMIQRQTSNGRAMEIEDEFWQKHSTAFLEMAFNAHHRERISHPDGYGKNTGDCGDTVEVFLVVENGIIRHAAFDVHGCLNTVACGATVVELVDGKPLDDAWDITPDTVVDYLKTLPESDMHCAEVAVGALYLAMADYEQKHRL
jgi:nitrogen fixation protein NifU and related proteins